MYEKVITSQTAIHFCSLTGRHCRQLHPGIRRDSPCPVRHCLGRGTRDKFRNCSVARHGSCPCRFDMDGRRLPHSSGSDRGLEFPEQEFVSAPAEYHRQLNDSSKGNSEDISGAHEIYPRHLRHGRNRQLRRCQNQYQRFQAGKHIRPAERHPHLRPHLRQHVLEQLDGTHRCNLCHTGPEGCRRFHVVRQLCRRHNQHNHCHDNIRIQG